MQPNREGEFTRQGETKFIRDCLICGRGVACDTLRTSSILLSCHESTTLMICESCREEYLARGVALVNPETESVIVIMDDAFRAIFHEPLPEQKIIYTEEEVLQRIHAVFAGRGEKNRAAPSEPVLLN